MARTVMRARRSIDRFDTLRCAGRKGLGRVSLLQCSFVDDLLGGVWMGQGGGDWDDRVESDVEVAATRMRQSALARCAIGLLLQIRQGRFDDFSLSIRPAASPPI